APCPGLAGWPEPLGACPPRPDVRPAAWGWPARTRSPSPRGYRPAAAGRPVEAVVGAVVAVAGPAGKVGTHRGGPRAAAHHRGPVQQPQPLRGGRGVVG